MDQKILWAVNKMPKTDDFPRELSSVQRNTINQAA